MWLHCPAQLAFCCHTLERCSKTPVVRSQGIRYYLDPALQWWAHGKHRPSGSLALSVIHGICLSCMPPSLISESAGPARLNIHFRWIHWALKINLGMLRLLGSVKPMILRNQQDTLSTRPCKDINQDPYVWKRSMSLLGSTCMEGHVLVKVCIYEQRQCLRVCVCGQWLCPNL